KSPAAGRRTAEPYRNVGLNPTNWCDCSMITTKMWLVSASCGGLIGVGGFVRVVGAPHERSRFDVDEAEFQGRSLEVAELVRVVVPDHGGVVRRGTQVLADGQDLAAHAAQILERRDDLARFLAQADHQSRL